MFKTVLRKLSQPSAISLTFKFEQEVRLANGWLWRRHDSYLNLVCDGGVDDWLPCLSSTDCLVRSNRLFLDNRVDLQHKYDTFKTRN